MKLLRWLFVLPVAIVGCDRAATTQPSAEREVTIYCSVDREFAEPILVEFERRNSITVHRIYDTEAGKTTGLLNRLIAEKFRPRADVWWSSEIFGTIQLAEKGIFAEYRPPSASDIPDQFRDVAGRWTAIGLRGRVLAFDPKRTKSEDLPDWWGALADNKYKGRICMADPRFGTTRGHMAAMLSANRDPDRMRTFLKGLRANNCRLADGNAQSVLLLTRGVVDFAMTDTDDAIAAKARGESVDWETLLLADPRLSSSINDTQPLWIPCTVAVINGGPNSKEGKELADYLVSSVVEEKLALSESKNIPVRSALREKLKIEKPFHVGVNYSAIAKKLDESDQLIRDILLK